MLLVSSDPSLVENCRSIGAAISGLDLEVLPELSQLEMALGNPGLAILLVHLVPESSTAPVVRALKLLAAQKRMVPLLVIGEATCAPQGLKLLRQGAADYLPRPLELGWLEYLVDSLTIRRRYQPTAPAPAAAAVQSLGAEEPFLYTAASGMEQVLDKIRMVAPQDTTVLLGGETGTGKTRLARLIHELSPRRNLPFLTVHSAALAANLIESEMFGHVRGAFTSADRDRVGKFAEVGGGTLLLDEIDTLPPAVQSKLLRAVEERVFEPVGSNQTLPLKARLIVASNQPLDQEVAARRFRADLYYRLNVISFVLPPLRERLPLIPHLVRNMISQFAGRNRRKVSSMSAEALRALQCYDWPGNIRELRNVVERAVALACDPIIQLTDLPDTILACVANQEPAPSRSVRPVEENAVARGRVASKLWTSHEEQGLNKSHLDEDSTLGQVRGQAEATRILEALARHGNNRLSAAAELGISRMTLYNKLRKYGILGA
jgi:DNA-binding NtrC family response regulator